MTGTRRKRLVPVDAVQAFEVRIVHWFDANGEAWISADVIYPHRMPPRHEVLGVIVDGMDILKGLYGDEDT